MTWSLCWRGKREYTGESAGVLLHQFWWSWSFYIPWSPCNQKHIMMSLSQMVLMVI